MNSSKMKPPKRIILYSGFIFSQFDENGDFQVDAAKGRAHFFTGIIEGLLLLIPIEIHAKGPKKIRFDMVWKNTYL